jgi:hypothetical protein
MSGRYRFNMVEEVVGTNDSISHAEEVGVPGWRTPNSLHSKRPNIDNLHSNNVEDEMHWNCCC